MRVLGGHLVALVIDNSLGRAAISEVPELFALYAAVAVGATMFVMASTNTEHAPAAGTALAVVSHVFTWQLVLFVVTSVAMLSAVHQLLRSHLRDLY